MSLLGKTLGVAIGYFGSNSLLKKYQFNKIIESCKPGSARVQTDFFIIKKWYNPKAAVYSMYASYNEDADFDKTRSEFNRTMHTRVPIGYIYMIPGLSSTTHIRIARQGKTYFICNGTPLVK
jgi:hypothetical protein